MVKITANTEGARAKLQRIQDGLSPEGIDSVIEKVALQTLADLVKATRDAIGVRPDGNRWNFEKPENKWIVSSAGTGKRLVSNNSKVMLWLDQGTKYHGPRKQFANVRFSNVKVGRSAKRRAAALYIPLTRRAAAGYHHGLVFGVDYILVKRVRGIRARHIVAAAKERLKVRLLEAMQAHVRRLIKG